MFSWVQRNLLCFNQLKLFPPDAQNVLFLASESLFDLVPDSNITLVVILESFIGLQCDNININILIYINNVLGSPCAFPASGRESSLFCQEPDFFY